MSFWDFLSRSTGNTHNPVNEANQYLDQIPGVGRQYYNPFIDRGARAGDTLEGEYGKLMNPTSFMDEIMKNYKTSEGAQYEQDKLGRGIGATAAAGGYVGTPEHQRQYGEMASDIMSKDQQQYLQNALGIYDKGLSGEQGFFNTGYNASSSLADLIGSTLASQGSLAFQGATQQNANNQALFNEIAKLFSTGAGAAFGGPSGAAIGSKLF